ncbi:MAG TPA: ABC transporter permease [Chloroflexia bacterium]|nr:ABC transporter permease [Chloroflexia bacterium]
MVIYVLRRVFQSLMLVLLFGLLIYSTLLWFIAEPMPIGQSYNRLKQQIKANPDTIGFETVNRAIYLEKRYKLDKPWPLSYLVWLFDPGDTETRGYDLSGNVLTTTKGIDVNILGLRIRGSGVLTGDFGTSEGFGKGAPISEILDNRWGSTFLLVGSSFGLALIVGVPLGILAALRKRTAVDNTIAVFTLGGLSLPPFVLGLLFIMFFAVLPKALHDQGWSWLPWLPSGGTSDTDEFWDRVRHLALPATTLAIPQIAWLSQYTRFAMLDVLRQDYIRTAWAKGLSARRVVFKHALRNTLIPVITQSALLLPTVLSSALVVETIFAYEGLGRVFYRAMGGCLATGIAFRDDPPPCPASGYRPIDTQFALVLMLILVLVVAISNLLADILYTVADPRISYASDKKSS